MIFVFVTIDSCNHTFVVLASRLKTSFIWLMMSHGSEKGNQVRSRYITLLFTHNFHWHSFLSHRWTKRTCEKRLTTALSRSCVKRRPAWESWFTVTTNRPRRRISTTSSPWSWWNGQARVWVSPSWARRTTWEFTYQILWVSQGQGFSCFVQCCSQTQKYNNLDWKYVNRSVKPCVA